MHVNVVNSYAATSEAVPVSFVSRELLPTDGNPTCEESGSKFALAPALPTVHLYVPCLL